MMKRTFKVTSVLVVLVALLIGYLGYAGHVGMDVVAWSGMALGLLAYVQCLLLASATRKELEALLEHVQLASDISVSNTVSLDLLTQHLSGEISIGNTFFDSDEVH